jgi:integrase
MNSIEDEERKAFLEDLQGKLTLRQVATIMRKRIPKGKTEKHGDGGGLILQCIGDARSWTFRYVDSAGRERTMGLGSCRDVSLPEARVLARNARRMRKHGRDPITERAALAVAREAQAKSAKTFEQVAKLYIEQHGDGWSKKHADQWRSSLLTYVYPIIGALAVSAIDRAAVLRCVQPDWKTKNETINRVRNRIELILDFAGGSGYRPEGPNPARWKGNLAAVLPAPGKKPVHLPSMPYADVPALMLKLTKKSGVAARALEFAILTAARSGEVRGATWDEIDLAKKLWIVPGARMKAGKEHRVPLSDAALAILMALPSRSGLLFPSPKKAGSALAPGAMIDDLGSIEKGFTQHGFRSAFSEWARERTHAANEVIEVSLAHAVGNAVQQAYSSKVTLIEKRRDLMLAWAHYLAHGEPSANVLQLKRSS